MKKLLPVALAIVVVCIFFAANNQAIHDYTVPALTMIGGAVAFFTRLGLEGR